MRAAASQERLPWEMRRAHAVERLVACAVPEEVVDPLEAVEVAEDQAQRLPGAPRALELHVEGLLEAAAVEQPGERVTASGVGQAPDPARDLVAGDRHQKAGAEERARGREPRPGRVVVEVAQDQQGGVEGPERADLEQRRPQAEEVEGVDRGQEVGQRAEQGLLAPEPDHRGGQAAGGEATRVEGPGGQAPPADVGHDGHESRHRRAGEDPRGVHPRGVRAEHGDHAEHGPGGREQEPGGRHGGGVGRRP